MCYVGPRLMAKREPFELKPILIVYNFAMVILSAYMCYEVSLTERGGGGKLLGTRWSSSPVR